MLNGALLFMVLFYVYPLKFMFDSLFARFIPTRNPPVPMELYSWRTRRRSTRPASS